MNKLILIFSWLLISCSNPSKDYRKAEDALDAGREYINAYLVGDFSKARFYALPDEKNQSILAEMEKAYRKKDKEGRQQLRTASIIIKEVKELTDSTTELEYSNSFENKASSLVILKRNQTWLVDASQKP